MFRLGRSAFSCREPMETTPLQECQERFVLEHTQEFWKFLMSAILDCHQGRESLMAEKLSEFRGAQKLLVSDVQAAIFCLLFIGVTDRKI